jgi:4-hydroxy-4-methyl-2-oxoglutarate aldolase
VELMNMKALKNLTFIGAAICMTSLFAQPAKAQLWTWTKEQLIEHTKAWTGDRLPDGRPKVSDADIERAKGLSQEEITINWGAPGATAAPAGGAGGAGGGRGPGGGGSGYSQYVGDWQLLQPGKRMAGRVFTALFMPARPDLDFVINSKMRDAGVTGGLGAQRAIDQLQPGDVFVVDIYGKKEGGTPMGDNLYYYVMKATHGGGIVINGAFRDLEGIAPMGMPAYYKSVHPTAVGGVTLAGYNIPITIGSVTVMPGDLAMGDREGVAFIPPQLVKGILDRADETHIHDEWTKKKFDEGKYKSAEIYSTPRDPALRKEYEEYLKQKLEELRKKQ